MNKRCRSCTMLTFLYCHLSTSASLTILEAMQAGLPVIATNIGGIPDIITNNQQGFLVGVNDQRELSERIRVLIRNKSLRQEFGVNAKKKFYSNYTITHFYDGLNAIFNEVLNS